MKKKNVFIVVLVLLAVAVTGLSFAYWGGAIKGSDTSKDGSVTIGEGKEVITSINLSNLQQETGLLVPAERSEASEAGAVESIELTFDVKWVEEKYQGQTDLTGVEATRALSVVVNNVQGDANQLIQFAITSGDIALNDANVMTVTIVITMTEPADMAQYNAIINAQITFDVVFTIAD